MQHVSLTPAGFSRLYGTELEQPVQIPCRFKTQPHIDTTNHDAQSISQTLDEYTSRLPKSHGYQALHICFNRKE